MPIISFKPDFIELLATEFTRDSKLGIVGATLFEPEGSAWREIRSPGFHTRGAVKMYSRACFEAIGGLASGLGWDTLDEALAMMLGFKSRSFRHIRAYHHRPQGSAGGYLKGNLAAGRAAYNGRLPSAVPDDACGEARPIVAAGDWGNLSVGRLSGRLPAASAETRFARAGQIYSEATVEASSADGVGMALSIVSSHGGAARARPASRATRSTIRNDAFSFWKLPENYRAQLEQAAQASEPLIRRYLFEEYLSPGKRTAVGRP